MKKYDKPTIVIDQVRVISKAGTFDDGSPWVSNKQPAVFHIPGLDFPIQCMFKVTEDKCIPPGEHTVGNGAFTVEKGGFLAVVADAQLFLDLEDRAKWEGQPPASPRVAVAK